MKKWYRKLRVNSGTGLVSLPRTVYDRWAEMDFNFIEMLYDEERNVVTIAPR